MHSSTVSLVAHSFIYCGNFCCNKLSFITLYSEYVVDRWSACLVYCLRLHNIAVLIISSNSSVILDCWINRSQSVRYLLKESKAFVMTFLLTSFVYHVGMACTCFSCTFSSSVPSLVMAPAFSRWPLGRWSCLRVSPVMWHTPPRRACAKHHLTDGACST